MKDNFFWPGFVLLAIAVSAMISTVMVAAYQRYEWIETTVLISVLGTIAGALWLFVEVRHVTSIDRQSVHARGGRPRQ